MRRLPLKQKDGARETPFEHGSQIHADAGLFADPGIVRLDRRGEERHFSRYHPSCVSESIRSLAHLSAVVTMGATHPFLLDRSVANGIVFLRSAAPGRVPRTCTNPGLAPSPGRFDARSSYFSPSSRDVVRYLIGKRMNTETTLRKDCGCALVVAIAEWSGDRQRVVRRRRTAGRR